MPNDEPEQRRLDMLHHIYLMMANGELHHAPFAVTNGLGRVLDLGTGTGIWAIDFADEHPNAIVIGTDLSPIQPTWVPPNCKFYVEDLESPWNYAVAEHFDFIHGRGLCGSVADWKKLFAQAYENLKPGGWFEMQEFDVNVYSDDGTVELATHLTSWLEELREASDRFGKPLEIAHQLKGRMEEAGFADIEQRIVQVSQIILSRISRCDAPRIENHSRFLLVVGLETPSINSWEGCIWHIIWILLKRLPWHYLPESCSIHLTK